MSSFLTITYILQKQLRRIDIEDKAATLIRVRFHLGENLSLI